MFYTHTIKFDGQVPIINLLYFDGKDIWSFNENHSLYQQYLLWMAEGNTPEEWNPDNINTEE